MVRGVANFLLMAGDKLTWAADELARKRRTQKSESMNPQLSFIGLSLELRKVPVADQSGSLANAL
jgi:hypothetical protein